MDTRSMRTVMVVAGVAWLVVAGNGLWSAIVDDGDDWELSYMVFSLALLIGAALTVTAAAWSTRQSDRRWLRLVGIVVASLGGVAAIVAWALPLWMTLLGVGFATMAVASRPSERRAIALLAVGQLAGVVVMIAAIEAEVGRQDSYGDYPAAGGIALVVTGAMTILALFQLARCIDGRPVMQGADGPAFGLSSTE